MKTFNNFSFVKENQHKHYLKYPKNIDTFQSRRLGYSSYDSINLKAKNENLLIFVHDLKNLLFPVLGYMETKNYEKSREKLLRICEKLHEIDLTLSDTQNDFLIKNILKIKKPIMEKSKIKLSYHIKIDQKISIDDEEFCRLVGNILDNAIKSCSKIPDVEKRFINFEISCIKDFLNIIAENPFLSNSSSKSSRKLISGYGLKSINSIVNKYKGEIHAIAHKNVFFTEIKIPFDKNKTTK